MRTIQKAIVVGLLGGMLAIHGTLFLNTWHLARQGYSDFTIFYTAGKIIRRGQAHHLYSDALQYQVQQEFASGVRIRKGPLPYNHPAFEALFFVPFTYLDYGTAFVVWDAINLVILAALPFILRRHIPVMRRYPALLWLLTLLAFFPILTILLQGQDVIFLLLFYALAFVALKRNADILAGGWLGLGMFKFHLVIPMIVILLCWKRNRAVLAFLGTTAVLAAISVAITGWTEAIHYPQYVLHLEKIMGRGAIVPADMPNLRGLLEGWSWAHAFPLPLHVFIIAVSIGLVLWVIANTTWGERSSQQFDLQFSLAVVVTVLVSYHAFAYDLVLLVIPILLLLNYANEAGRIDFRKNMALWLPVGLLFFTPLYMLLWFRLDHLNVFVVFLLLWLWGIRRELAATNGAGELRSS